MSKLRRICADKEHNQTLIIRISDSYIAILCRNYEEYSIFDQHALNLHGDIKSEGSAALFHLRILLV